jgi:hypothetical protein
MQLRLFKTNEKICEIKKHPISLENKSDYFKEFYYTILEKNKKALIEFQKKYIYISLPFEKGESPISILASENNIEPILFLRDFIMQSKKQKYLISEINEEAAKGLIFGGHLKKYERFTQVSPVTPGGRQHIFAGAAKSGKFNWIDEEIKKTDGFLTPKELASIIKNGIAASELNILEKYTNKAKEMKDMIINFDVANINVEEFSRIVAGIPAILGASQAGNKSLLFSLLNKVPLELSKQAINNAIAEASDYGQIHLVDELIVYGKKLIEMGTLPAEENDIDVMIVNAIRYRFKHKYDDLALMLMRGSGFTFLQTLFWLQAETQGIFVAIHEGLLPVSLGCIVASYFSQLGDEVFTQKEVENFYRTMDQKINELSYYLKKNIPYILQKNYENSAIILKNRHYLLNKEFSDELIAFERMQMKLTDEIKVIPMKKIKKPYGQSLLKLKLWIDCLNPELLKILSIIYNDFPNHQQADMVFSVYSKISKEILESDVQLTTVCKFFLENSSLLFKIKSRKSGVKHQNDIGSFRR